MPTAASRVCDLTGKRANNAYVVTFSHKRNKKLQQPNLQYKKVRWNWGRPVQQVGGPAGRRALGASFCAPAVPSFVLMRRAFPATMSPGQIYWPEGQRWVKLRVCTKALKTVEKKGLAAMAAEAGIDLWKLPYEDARPARKEWLAARAEVVPPMAKQRRAMKNPEKLAASRKTPLVARFISGKVALVRSEQAE